MSTLTRLVQQKIITKEQASKLEVAAKAASVSVEEMALQQDIVDEETLFSAKAKELKLPLRKVAADSIPPEVLRLIPEDSAKYYRIVPLSLKDNKLEVGMVQPEDTQAQQALKFLARQGKFSYVSVLITPSVFHKIFAQYRDTKTETGRVLEELEQGILVLKEYFQYILL